MIVALVSTALGYAAAPANADIITRSGTLDSGDSTMGVVSIDGEADTCGTQGGFAVHYEVIPWTAPVGGTVSFRLTSTPTNMASFYVYDGPFDPANGEENCLAGDNSADNPGNEKIVTLNVQDEKTYRLVVFDDTFDQLGGSYEFSIEIPGGKAIDPAQGTGKKYVALPRSFSCDDLTATVKWKRTANRVESAVFKAGRRTVATLGDRRIAPGRTTTLKDLPGQTRKLVATLQLKNGGKAVVSRTYTRC
jgi:hypothetical protein